MLDLSVVIATFTRGHLLTVPGHRDGDLEI